MRNVLLRDHLSNLRGYGLSKFLKEKNTEKKNHWIKGDISELFNINETMLS